MCRECECVCTSECVKVGCECVSSRMSMSVQKCEHEREYACMCAGTCVGACECQRVRVGWSVCVRLCGVSKAVGFV